MTRAALLVLALAGCAAAPVRSPVVPQIRCVNLAPVPSTPYWLYLCEFPDEPADTVFLPDVQLGGQS